MKLPKAIVSLVCLVTFARPAAARPDKPPVKSKALVDLTTEYLDGLFKAKPHLATFMGDHRHDGDLPDLTEFALKSREAQLVSQRQKLDRILPVADSLDQKIDCRIMRDGIDLELLYIREIRDWTWDPRLSDSFPYYDPRELVAGRLSDIIHGDFAPEAERRKSVNSQLRALPRFLDQVKAALNNPPRVYTEQAIKDNKGRIEFFNTEVKEFTAKDGEGEAARKEAVQSLTNYQAYLEKELLPRSKGSWQLGAALYHKKFPLALQTTLTPEEVVTRAEAAFKAKRKDLYEIARKLHSQRWPGEPQPVEGADAKTQSKVIARVRDELGREHAKPDALVQAHAQKLEGLRTFIEKNDLLTLPKRESLRVEAMPAYKRGSAGAEYLAPGILEKKPDFRATYYVDPIDPTWPAEKVESYMRGQNDYDVELTAAHEAYPGHHTQFSYERKDLDPLRAVLWNAAMVEGWAVYGTTLLVRLGYGEGRALGYQFRDTVGALTVATNILLDIKLQTGAMTDAEAVRFMVEEGFQERAVAEKKLLRAKLDSTQLAQYFLGAMELAELEKDARQRWTGPTHPPYTQRAFNEAVIGHGSIAVKYLRSYLLGEKPPAP